MTKLPSWAVPGAKVVCIDDRPRAGFYYVDPCPPAGTVVTIDRRVRRDGWGTMLAIVGWPNISKGQEIGWLPERFRPLVPTKSQAEDVALFKRIAKEPNPALQLEVPEHPYNAPERA